MSVCWTDTPGRRQGGGLFSMVQNSARSANAENRRKLGLNYQNNARCNTWAPPDILIRGCVYQKLLCEIIQSKRIFLLILPDSKYYHCQCYWTWK